MHWCTQILPTFGVKSMIRKLTLLSIIFLICTSHDMFLKMDTYYLEAGKKAAIKLLNGTFDRSENVIARDRMRDVSLITPAGMKHPHQNQWSEKGEETILAFTTDDPGTYVLGVSTQGKTIDLKATDFNEYLKHDGILDALAQRKKDGKLGTDVTELYSKHVKTIFQVGTERSDHYKEKLNYPIEFIPLKNPYLITRDEAAPFLLLRDGRPLMDQLVYVGQAHQAPHQHDEEQTHDHRSHEHLLRTDKAGRVAYQFDTPGPWYLRTIHMTGHADDLIQYESSWATITFEIK